MIPTELNAAPSSTPPLGTRVVAALARRRRPQLLPPAAAHPSALAWVWLLPQALLIFLNLRAWDLISGEVQPSEHAIAITIFSLETALWLGGAILFVVCLLRKAAVPRLAGGALLIGASFYLSVCFLDSGSAIPNSVQQWMLPPEQWLFNQFALVGLGALYGAFRLLCPDREGDRVSDSVITVAALFSPFAMILLAMGIATSSQSLGFNPEPTRYVFGPLYIAASLLSVGGVLRLCISAYVFARKSSPLALGILTFIVALALPIAGLVLNSSIGFPADFQLPVIYALAIVNGLVLTLPNFSHPILHRIVWLAQCAMFPFTLYFFAVFLPQLPLMPIAAIIFALGLLICVPSALFLLHGCRILDGLHAETRDGSRWLPTVLAISAIAFGPVLVTARIISDRVSLNQALDYLQYPDYSHRSIFPGHRPALRNALLNLRDFKEGHYLPFYSEFYNWLVFDNLLLPDRKLAEVWRTFFGGDMPPSTARQSPSPFFPERRGRTNQEILSGLDGARPSANATTKSLRTSVSSTHGEVRATASVMIENPTEQTTEYRTLIHVPAGVWISGMRLTIGSAPVPAQLFEERAALWVYSKITEASVRPRDPGILRYVGPESAELRVYPVEGRGTRSVEIDFVYPDNISPAITVDGHSLELPPAARDVALSSGATVWVPLAALSGMPVIQRVPQPQLIIDVSRGSLFQKNPAALHEAILAALRAFPSAETARVLFANFDLREFRNGQAISVADLRLLDPADLLSSAGPFEGGFRKIFAIESALAGTASADSTRQAREFPAPVVLLGDTHPEEDPGPLANFARFAPDEPSWWSLEPHASTPRSHPLDPAASPGRTGTVPVHLLKLGAEAFAIRDGESGVLVASHGQPPLALAAYDPSKQAFIPVSSSPDIGAGSGAGAEAWELASKRIFEPSPSTSQSLASLLALARKAGVLTPSTAYMVVENTAQWKMLERTEKKTTKAHEALALSNPSATPEPGTIALLLVAGLALLAYRQFFRPGLRS